MWCLSAEHRRGKQAAERGPRAENERKFSVTCAEFYLLGSAVAWNAEFVTQIPPI